MRLSLKFKRQEKRDVSSRTKPLSKEERRKLAEEFAKIDSSEIMREFNLEKE